jgi:hypothetical protein
MNKSTYSIMAGLIICTFLLGCSFSVTKQAPGVYGYQVFASTDEQIRYILTDIQLGGKTTKVYGIDLYNTLRNYSVVQQALSLWDQGVRVVNIDRFYRLTYPATTMVNSVPVEIIGLIYDQETGASLNPKDVILTTDLQPTNEMPTSTTTPENTPIPTVGASENLCDNPYWPIREGAYWIYEEEQSFQFKLTVHNIVSNADETTFALTRKKIGGNGTPPDKIYHCTRDGIFDEQGHYMLPFNVEFQAGASYQANGQTVKVSRIEQFNVPAGNFNAVKLCWQDFYTWCFAYAQGVGPVQGNFSAMDWQDNLVSYYIP